eukprot:4588911-Amphidinium_carterae.1
MHCSMSDIPLMKYRSLEHSYAVASASFRLVGLPPSCGMGVPFTKLVHVAECATLSTLNVEVL